MGWSMSVGKKRKNRRFLVDIYFNMGSSKGKYIYYGTAVSARQAWYYGLCKIKNDLKISSWITTVFDSKVQTHNNSYDTKQANASQGYYLFINNKWRYTYEEKLMQLLNEYGIIIPVDEGIIYLEDK